jgi:hypothetical protein
MISKLRLVKLTAGHIDGGTYVKPLWACKFTRKGHACSIRVKCGGEQRPLGQDVIDAMQSYVDDKLVTIDQLLDIRIVE